MARKLRTVELRAQAIRVKRGDAYDYNIPAKRAEECRRVEAAEGTYAGFTAN